MAQSKLLNPVSEVSMECTICMCDFTDPRLLPCLHTFCLNCLKKHKEKMEGNKNPFCPLCRREFDIPTEGLEKLKLNDIMARLVLDKEIREGKHKMSKCELCENMDAQFFCMECGQCLCSTCKIAHSKCSSTRAHKIVVIEEKPSEEELYILKPNYCLVHKADEIKLYCCDCKILLCYSCHATKHNKHICQVPAEVALLKEKEVAEDQKHVEKCIQAETEMMNSEKMKSNLYNKEITEVQKNIEDSLSELINHLSVQKSKLVSSLENIKLTNSKGSACDEDESQFLCTEMKGFLAYSKMVVERGADCEVIGVAGELHNRAEELIQRHEKRSKIEKPEKNCKFLKSVTSEIRGLKELILKTDFQSTLDYAIKSQDENTPQQTGFSVGLSECPLEFTTVSGIKVTINKGNIVDQKVDVIVNAANTRLQHGSGVAGAIRDACGEELVRASDQYIQHYGKLKIGEPMHTTSGKLAPRVEYVVHVAGPNTQEVKDERKCRELLLNAFYNSLFYGNEVLRAKSIAIPAISSGIFGVPMKVVAQCSWDALVQFESDMTHLKADERHLKQIIFVNIDDQTVTAMHSAFTEQLKQNPDFENKPGRQAASSLEHKPRRLLISPDEPVLLPKGTSVDDKSTLNRRLLRNENDILLSFRKIVGGGNKKIAKYTKEEKATDSKDAASADASDDDCSICKDKITDLKTLPCKHKFCKECVDMWFKNKPSCPDCGAMFGALKGNQPEDGTMTINAFPGSLPGYERYGVIEITYSFRVGIQGKDHPNPGARYQGTMRKAYLPDNEEGQEVLKLLQEAFKARLIFTVGKSVTSGRDNVVTWNDIHHKTSLRGGEFGYPDPTYLKRVKEELATKGIKP